MSFNKSLELFDKLGIQYRRAHEYRTIDGKRISVELNAFSDIRLPLSEIEWCHLCMSIGDAYVGGCCGTMSSLQDVLNYVFRFEAPWISAARLAEIATLIDHHDDISGYYGVGFHSLSQSLDELSEKWDKFDVWDKIAFIWHNVKDHWMQSKPSTKHPKIPEIEEAISILSDTFDNLNWHLLLGLAEEKDMGPDKVRRAFLLGKLLPPLKTLNDNLSQLELGDISGWAIVDTDKDKDRICRNRLGLCVYESKEEAEKIINLWKENEDYKDTIILRPIAIDKHGQISWKDL